MKGWKHSVWTILGSAAAVTLMLPRLALSEFGVCPPFTKAFGPGESDEIVEFLEEISTREGGGTVVLLPGTEVALEEDVYDYLVYSPVCIRSVSNEYEEPVPRLHAVIAVEEGPLTMQGVHLQGQVVVRSNGAAYLNHVEMVDSGVLVYSGGESQLSDVRLSEFANEGTASIDKGVVFRTADNDPGGWMALTNVQVFGAVFNDGVAVLDGVVVTDAYGIKNTSGSLTIVRSTVARTNNGLLNYGGRVEVGQSIFAANKYGDCLGDIIDAGFNVLERGEGCNLIDEKPSTFLGDPLFMPGTIELSQESPAVDRVPIQLSTPTDGLGRDRVDGDRNGVIASDSGALEYGYAGVEVTVRTWPYWTDVGEVNLSTDTSVIVMVASGGLVDPTSILFDSVEVEGLDRGALRGPAYHDYSRDGLLDYVVWYRLDRMPPLACGQHDQSFDAMTTDGQMVNGQLRFIVTGCAP